MQDAAGKDWQILNVLSNLSVKEAFLIIYFLRLQQPRMIKCDANIAD